MITGNSVVDYERADGGAVCCSASQVSLSHCIIAYNSAGLSPTGGIKVEKESAVLIKDSIIWANSGEEGSEIVVDDDSILTVSYSDIQGGPGGILLRRLDLPRRVPPRQEGGLNWGPGNIDADPRFVDPNGGDYHLSLHSLCINAGDSNFVAGPGQTDMDGEGRIINGRIDIGPDEVDYEGPLIGINPSKWLFDANEGGPNPEAQSFSVYNSGPGTISWEIDYDCNWLDVGPTSGVSDGDSDEILVSVDVGGMDVGLYRTKVWIRDPTVVNSPQSLTVSLHIRGMTVDVPADYPTMQAAIDDVLEGGTVTVADGTYSGEGNQDIDFRGKAITVRSESGPENCVIDIDVSEYDPGSRGFYFHSGEDANSVLAGFTITNGAVASCSWIVGGAGILCSMSSPTIRDCVIANNFARTAGWCRGGSGGGGLFLNQSNARIANCLIVGNIGGVGAGILCKQSSPIITNCTISDNLRHGITVADMSYPVIVNSILWGNSDGQIIVELWSPRHISSAVVVFSNVEDGWGGLGNIVEDPCFVSPGYFEPGGPPYYNIYDGAWIDGDYHLKSEGWRWDSRRGLWTWDNVTSRCIDAGNPASSLGYEPPGIPGDPNNDWGRNVRINMGAYGGTAQASIAPKGWAVAKDYNNDGIANFTDFACRSGNQVASAGE
ncbi:MAG: right-handed parallel beta-helix repeat-containing protein, partial [Planctomycetota bacterium]